MLARWQSRTRLTWHRAVINGTVQQIVLLVIRASTIGGVTALWFYLATYGLVTVGVFALLAAAGAERPLQTDADLAGLSQTHPAIAVLLAISLFSLTGLPPTAGFWGKLNLFSASWSASSAWGVWLAIAIAANAAVAAWYYLRLIAAMMVISGMIDRS